MFENLEKFYIRLLAEFRSISMHTKRFFDGKNQLLSICSCTWGIIKKTKRRRGKETRGRRRICAQRKVKSPNSEAGISEKSGPGGEKERKGKK